MNTETIYITMRYEGDVIENDFHPCLMRDVPKGEFFVKKPTARLEQNVMTKESYIRESKKYYAQGVENDKESYISGDTVVYIGFTY